MSTHRNLCHPNTNPKTLSMSSVPSIPSASVSCSSSPQHQTSTRHVLLLVTPLPSLGTLYRHPSPRSKYLSRWRRRAGSHAASRRYDSFLFPGLIGLAPPPVHIPTAYFHDCKTLPLAIKQANKSTTNPHRKQKAPTNKHLSAKPLDRSRKPSLRSRDMSLEEP